MWLATAGLEQDEASTLAALKERRKGILQPRSPR
jgi:hypothetical protein